MFSKGANTYDFPKKIFTPEATQPDVYAEFKPLVSEFVDTPGRNVMLLAYGQTGTGKTHTIFGAKEAALNPAEEQEWGIFPKVVNETFKEMSSRGNKFKLYISAFETYLMECFDLLNKNAPVAIDAATGPRSTMQVEITKMEDLQGVLEMIFKNRTSTGTKMNQGNKGHDGSSRSHAALILTLVQVDKDEKFQKTQFHLIDLAGAERPDKTGVDRASPYDILVKAMKGEKMGVGE